jgi:UDP-hydrolysing UDP-N-acetyl-D-glucosamine 2-epimerase
MRKVCVFSSTRAEYGLLKPVMQKIQSHPFLQLQTLVSGTHLSPEFGSTYRVFEEDGLPVSEKVEMLLSSDTAEAICTSMGLGLMGYGQALSRLSPDVLVILGDRYEAMCVAAAAAVLNVPIAHIHGGELTAGAMDDAFRHAITKMSLLHFTAAEEYRRRVIQLGENPERVYNVGALGAESIRTLQLITREDFCAKLDLREEIPFLMVTFHPATNDPERPSDQFEKLLRALDEFQDVQVIFTGVNADTNGRGISSLTGEYLKANPARCRANKSLGHLLYLSGVKHCQAVVGNSSSGLLEAPSLGTPTVDIGSRQGGRLRAESVLHCEVTKDDIVRTLKKALSSKFQKISKKTKNPYEKAGTTDAIVKTLSDWKFKEALLKSFFDLDFNR